MLQTDQIKNKHSLVLHAVIPLESPKRRKHPFQQFCRRTLCLVAVNRQELLAASALTVTLEEAIELGRRLSVMMMSNSVKLEVLVQCFGSAGISL